MTRILLAALVLLVFVGAWWLAKSSRPARTVSLNCAGTDQELERLIAALMNSTQQAYLIATVSGTDDFLQMTGGPTGVQIDFPLITPRQQGFESTIRQAATVRRLKVKENRGSDGSRFLDIDVTDDSRAIAQICRTLMRDVYSTSHDTVLQYEGEVFE